MTKAIDKYGKEELIEITNVQVIYSNKANELYEVEGEEFCEDVFDAFVKKNQSVRVDELVNKIYCPVRARQTIMRIIIYCTDSTEVEFVDEPGVSKLGELSIDLGKSPQEDKTVTVTMRFGATSIMVTVTNKRGETR